MKSFLCVILCSTFIFQLKSQTLSKTEVKIAGDVDAGIPSTMLLLIGNPLTRLLIDLHASEN